MDENVKRAIILEHYQNPRHRGLVDDNSYEKISTNSKSCIDQVDLQLKLKNNKIEDVRFDGEACAICTSSTSILVETLIGKSIEEALDIINNYENMIEEKSFEKEKIGEAVVYSDIAKQPNRKKCATLTWEGTKKLLEDVNEQE